jgi:hypothetical protein
MTDTTGLAEQLREPNGMADSALPPGERKMAADALDAKDAEIARLREALEPMLNARNMSGAEWFDAMNNARAALRK